MADHLTIVLTAAITPTAPFVALADPAARRVEYLQALAFYRQFAPVIFLENSGYALHADHTFQALTNVTYYELPKSASPERGKGYQEFEMLESWVRAATSLPSHFMKVTGRYLYRNFAALLADYERGWPAKLVIDLCPRSGRALTSLFGVETAFFQQHLHGLYAECDDRNGDWVERQLYRRVHSYSVASVRSFAIEPDLQAICGSTGEPLAVSSGARRARQILRTLNCTFDRQRLWYKR